MSALCRRFGLETIPDQSTLWRSWHYRFTADLRETVEKAARTILIRANRADVSVPRELPSTLDSQGTEEDAQLDDQTILNRGATITEVGLSLETIIDDFAAWKDEYPAYVEEVEVKAEDWN